MGVVASRIEPGLITGNKAELDEIIRTRATRAVYQPIVELDSGRVIGWEALARGPGGLALGFPDMFGAASRLGLAAELDHCCQAAAINGAIASGLGRRQELFVNVEPDVWPERPHPPFWSTHEIRPRRSYG